MKKVHFKLKALRVEHDMTQEEVSSMLKIHEATYNRKEQGLSKFTLDEAKQLSDFFGLTIEQIFFMSKVQLN